MKITCLLTGHWNEHHFALFSVFYCSIILRLSYVVFRLETNVFAIDTCLFALCFMLCFMFLWFIIEKKEFILRHWSWKLNCCCENLSAMIHALSHWLTYVCFFMCKYLFYEICRCLLQLVTTSSQLWIYEHTLARCYYELLVIYACVHILMPEKC